MPPSKGWQNVRVLGTPDLHSVACHDDGYVFVAGASGTLLHRGPTSPPGIVFTKQPVGNPATTMDLHTVAFAGPICNKNGICDSGEDQANCPADCGGGTCGDGSCDGGESCTSCISDCQVTRCPTYYAVAGGKGYEIWETMDLGKTWTAAPQCSAFLFETFHALHLDTITSGFGAGVAINNQGGGYKYYTSYSWVCGPTPYPNEVFYDVFRLGKNGWIVGETGGKIYRTEDGGTNWTPITTSTQELLRGVFFHSLSLGLAVGDKGTVLRSTDGGKVWVAVASGVTEDLYDVTMVDASTGWAVGESGTLLQTTDGGQSWTLMPSGVPERLEAICFTSAQEGWAVGKAGVVIHTKSGGIGP